MSHAKTDSVRSMRSLRLLVPSTSFYFLHADALQRLDEWLRIQLLRGHIAEVLILRCSLEQDAPLALNLFLAGS
eukprot:4387651-Heterocapsa_arctica.AAC.1